MKKLGCLILCALMLALVLMAAGVPAGAAEPDSAVTPIADVDPEALSSGITNYPLMKTYVGGIKLTF